MITIILEILFYVLFFISEKYIPKNIVISRELIFQLPMLLFSLSILTEFIIWVKKNDIKKKKVKLIIFLTLTIITIVFNFIVAYISGSVR